MDKVLKEFVYNRNGWDMGCIPVQREPSVSKVYKLVDVFGNTIVQGAYSLCVHVRTIKYGKNSNLKIKVAK